jgi:ribosome-binding factor A
MKSSYQRKDRVSDIIRREVSEVLSRDVRDPRLSFVTITHVRVSKDLKSAKIFFTTIKEGDELKAILEGLKSASGFVQRKLGSRIHLRYTPHISFVYDSSVENGSRMEKILKNIEGELEGKL